MTYILPKNLLIESGIRNIRELSKRYKKAKIYFHQDLDGVTTALGMKYYLENNGIKVVDAETIQYGDTEFSVKKPDASGEVMPVLVDFAHGKPMFVIHTDHHDSQVGVEKNTSTSFKQSRSNVETVSQILSPSDIFPSDDIKMISTVDSADFVSMGVTVDDVMSFVFSNKTNEVVNGSSVIKKFILWVKTNLGKKPKLNNEFQVSGRKKIMSLVTNKLLLAYKNKPKFLERLVLESTPSLVNIYVNILKMAKESGYATPEEMTKHQTDYTQAQKSSDSVKYDKDYGIITQYGGGSMFKPGSYDRYTPFKNNPDANFIVLVWPMGLMQSSCNPFQTNRSLKGVNLGDIAQEVLIKFKEELQNVTLTFDTIKYFSEKHKSFTEDSVGFTYSDMVALFNDTDGGIKGLGETPKGSSSEYTVERWQAAIKKIMSKPYSSLSDKEVKALKLLSLNGWDMIQSQSGGHKCITNISGFMYFGKNGVPFMKKIAREFYNELKRRIDVDKDVDLASED